MEIEDLTESQKSILLLLSSKNHEPIKGKTWFQKEVFLMAKNIPELEDDTSFEADFYGPYSENAEEELEDLKLEGMVSSDKTEKIRITEEGIKLVKRLEKETSKDRLILIEEIKEFLNDLSLDELLVFIYYTYEDMTTESYIKEKLEKIRVEIAKRLFLKKKVSLEKASELAGLPKSHFSKLV